MSRTGWDGRLEIVDLLPDLLALARAPSSGPALLAFWSAVMALLFGAIGHYWRTRDMGFDESKH